MKRNLLFTTGICLMLAISGIYAQVQPNAEENLTHFYDFEDDSPDDLIGTANGIENGSVDYSDGALDITELEEPGYISFLGEEIAINTFSEITIETWAIPSENENAGKALMMWSFGLAGGVGNDYLFFVPARRTDELACRMSLGATEPWNNEQGVIVAEAASGDSTLHHYVVTIDSDNNLSTYVDGEMVGDAVELTGDHGLASLSNSNAFIGKSVYDADPTWKGLVELFAIWDAALTEEEISWLYEAGEKRSPIASVENIERASSYNFYVANNQLFVRNINNSQDMSVVIYNITGNLVYQNKNFQNGETLNLSQGVYIIKSSSMDNNSVQRVVIK